MAVTPAPAQAVCPLCSERFDTTDARCPHDQSPLLPWVDDPLVGSVIDARFEVTARLGEGGMGTVYTARQHSVDRVVALKMVRAQLVEKTETAKRFLREARLAARVAHPHIVAVFDSGRDPGGQLYLALEYIPGRTLAQLLSDEGALPPDRAVRIAQQICDALIAAHALSVIHRDLKPQNLILVADTAEDFVKVLDFGLARSLAGDESTLTREGTMFGTPAYMPPEVARGLGCDERGDLYALGVVLYEMLAGQRPFLAQNPIALAMHQAYHEAPPLPDSVPDALAQVVTRLMAKAPDDRYPSAESTRAALESARVPSPAAPTPDEPLPPSVGQNRWLPLIALGLLLLVGLMWWALSGPTQPDPPTAAPDLIGVTAPVQRVVLDAAADTHLSDTGLSDTHPADTATVDAQPKRQPKTRSRTRRPTQRRRRPLPDASTPEPSPPAEDFIIPGAR